MGGGGGARWERTMAKTAARIDNRIRMFISVRVSIIPDARTFFFVTAKGAAGQGARERGMWRAAAPPHGKLPCNSRRPCATEE